jgi:hypothetical protein
LVPALIVGDNDLRISGGQLGRFRDHPHAGFGPMGDGDHAAQVGIANAYRIVQLLSAQLTWRANEENPDGEGRQARELVQRIGEPAGRYQTRRR